MLSYHIVDYCDRDLYPFQNFRLQDVYETISKIYTRDEGITLGQYSIADIYAKNHEVKVG